MSCTKVLYFGAWNYSLRVFLICVSWQKCIKVMFKNYSSPLPRGLMEGPTWKHFIQSWLTSGFHTGEQPWTEAQSMGNKAATGPQRTVEGWTIECSANLLKEHPSLMPQLPSQRNMVDFRYSTLHPLFLLTRFNSPFRCIWSALSLSRRHTYPPPSLSQSNRMNCCKGRDKRVK